MWRTVAHGARCCNQNDKHNPMSDGYPAQRPTTLAGLWKGQAMLQRWGWTLARAWSVEGCGERWLTELGAAIKMTNTTPCRMDTRRKDPPLWQVYGRGRRCCRGGVGPWPEHGALKDVENGGSRS